MWWVYIFQLPLCFNIKRHLRLQTLPRAASTMLRLWAKPSHTLSIWGTVKCSPTDLNLGLEHSSTSNEWHIDCTKLKLRSQTNLLAKKYMAALRTVLKPMVYQWSLTVGSADKEGAGHEATGVESLRVLLPLFILLCHQWYYISYVC